MIADTHAACWRHTSSRIFAMAPSIRSILLHLLISTLPVLAALPSAAVSVTVNGVDYDVTIFDGSYDDYSSLFREPPAGQMPWWSDPSGGLALQFAFQVYDSLGSGSDVGSGPVLLTSMPRAQAHSKAGFKALQIPMCRIYRIPPAVLPSNMPFSAIPFPTQSQCPRHCLF